MPETTQLSVAVVKPSLVEAESVEICGANDPQGRICQIVPIQYGRSSYSPVTAFLVKNPAGTVLGRGILQVHHKTGTLRLLTPATAPEAPDEDEDTAGS